MSKANSEKRENHFGEGYRRLLQDLYLFETGQLDKRNSQGILQQSFNQFLEKYFPWVFLTREED